MKKYISYFGVIALTIFSFYYTDKATELVMKNDKVMKEIVSNKDNYKIDPINAIINNDEIITGLNGKQININKSYQNMKKINAYNDTMLVFEEVNPLITFKDEYDKYIIGGNEIKNEVALVFKVIDTNYIDRINNILLDKNVSATFFADGSIIEDNINVFLELTSNNNEIENLGYNSKYTNDKFNYTNNMIESITRIEPKYCYSDYRNDDILELCSKNKMYTIKPTINATNYPFSTIKNNVSSGNIIGLNINNEVVKELPSIISYLKQKGYKLVTVDELLSEKYIDEK